MLPLLLKSHLIRSCTFLLVLLLSPGALSQSEFDGVSRIIAVGDVHGDYDAFVDVLRDAGVINRRRNWIAGDAHLVQVGDLPDRGPDTDKAIELLQKLEEQALEDGGRVHALIGNHEAMNILGDLRYVHPGEYAAFRGSQSRQYRNSYYQQTVASQQANDPEFEATSAYRDEFDERFPLGYVEHRIAWAPEGDIGSWVLQHNAIVKINRVLFAHAGISPEVLGMSLDDINAQIRHELSGNLGEEPGLSERDDGPLWYRGLAQNEESVEQAHVEAVLAHYDVDHIVVGHTPGAGIIVPRFEGAVLLIDTGLSAYYGGHGASLLIDESGLYAQQGEERFPIPHRESPLSYLQQRAASKEDAPAGLQRLIEQYSAPEAIQP